MTGQSANLLRPCMYGRIQVSTRCEVRGPGFSGLPGSVVSRNMQRLATRRTGDGCLRTTERIPVASDHPLPLRLCFPLPLAALSNLEASWPCMVGLYVSRKWGAIRSNGSCEWCGGHELNPLCWTAQRLSRDGARGYDGPRPTHRLDYHPASGLSSGSCPERSPYASEIRVFCLEQVIIQGIPKLYGCLLHSPCDFQCSCVKPGRAATSRAKGLGRLGQSV